MNSVAKRRRSAARVLVLACLSAASYTHPAQSATVSWVLNGTGDWSVPSNWSAGLPGPSDDAVNFQGSSITHSVGTDTINSFLSSGALNLSGGAIAASNPGTSTFEVDNTFTMSGGTLRGFTINAGSLSPAVTIGNTGNNFFDNIRSNVGLNLASTGQLRVVNGLTLNGTATLNNNAILAFQDTQSLGGNAQILFGGAGNNRFAIDGTATLSVGSTVFIHGQNGIIGQAAYVGGTSKLINNGHIAVDVGGGSITLQVSSGASDAVLNTGSIEALNGGVLNLNNNLTNSGGGSINIDATSRVNQNAVTITGGTINVASGGAFVVANNGNDFLDSVTVNGDINLQSTGQERILNQLTLNGTARLDGSAILAFQGSQSLNRGTVLFGASGNNRMSIEGTSALTVGSLALVHGQNGVIGTPAYISGTTNLINNGRISSDVSGGSIGLSTSSTAADSVLNNSILEAANGGILNLNANVTQGSSGHIDVGPLSRINQNAITVTSGTINNASGGEYFVTNNQANFFNGVWFNGNIDLTSTGQLRNVNGLTLVGTVSMDNGGVIGFGGTQSLVGSGSIVLGATGNNRFSIDGNSTLTVASGVTVRGTNGTVGQAVYAAGTGVLINNGTIAADVNAGSITVNPNSLINNNRLQAINGGGMILSGGSVTNANAIVVGNGIGSSRLTVSTGVTQTGVGSINVQSGNQLTLSAGQITGGTLVDSGSLVFSNSGNNILSGVNATVASMNLTATGQARFFNGSLTLNGAGTIDNGGQIAFDGTQDIAGNGTIVLGGLGNNRIGIDDTATLTIDSGITIRGQNGTIGPALYNNGTGKLINNGTIAIDVALGSGTIDPSSTALDSIRNNNTLAARNGGTLNLGSNVTQGPAGHIDVADAASRVNINGITVTGGTVNNTAGGNLFITNNGANFFDTVTANGALNLASTGQLRILNGLTLNGTATVDNGGVIAFQGSQNFTTGTIAFGAIGNNRLGIDLNSTLTLGASTVIRGQNATIGPAVFLNGTGKLVNGGRIAVDVTGGTFTLQPSSTAADSILNTGIIQTLNGSVLNLNSSVTNATGGHIDSDAAGRINQNGIRITGGTINIASGGAFVPSNSGGNFLDGVTVNGDINLNATGQERIDNNLTLNGTATLNNSSLLAFDPNQTLAAGTIVFGAVGNNRVSIEGPGTASLTLAPGTSISGAVGTIGTPAIIGGTTQLINNGSISANVSGGTLTLAPSSTAANGILNNGTITATGGGALVLNSNINYSGGVLQVIDPASRLTANAALVGGALHNDGTFTHASSSAVSVIGPIDGAGAVIMNNSGRLTTTHVRQASLTSSAGTLAIAAGGGTVGTSRVGALSITGSGHVDLSNHDLVLDYSGSSPITSVRTMLQTGYAAGAWTGAGLISSAAGGSTHMGIGYGEATSKFSTFPATFSGQSIDNTTVIVQFTPAADANLDGTVDTVDFNTLAANFGGTGKVWTQADFNYDGLVDTVDFNLLAANFGFQAPPEAPSSSPLGALVPEPHAIALLAGLGAATMRRRRR